MGARPGGGGEGAGKALAALRFAACFFRLLLVRFGGRMRHTCFTTPWSVSFFSGFSQLLM